MKVLVVLCAVVAGCLAKPNLVVPSALGYSSVYGVANPLAYATPYAASYAAPYAAAPYAAPYATSYAALPAAGVVPVAHTYAAPAPVVARTVVAAPAPVVAAAPAVVHAPVAGVKSQYHAQNEHGEASYGHAEPGQTHNAVQDAHGNKVGSFSYVNPEGQVLRTDYVADAAGYRVASNALPAAPIVAPIDTPEVAAAKAAFHNDYALRAAGHLRRRRSAVLVQTPASTAPLAYSAPAHLAYAAPAPLAYAAPAPLVHAAPAPLAYAAPAPLVHAAPAHVAYAAPAPIVHAAPAHVAYAAPAPLAHAVPAVRHATLTTVVNNPGHAVSYRVD